MLLLVKLLREFRRPSRKLSSTFRGKLKVCSRGGEEGEERRARKARRAERAEREEKEEKERRAEGEERERRLERESSLEEVEEVEEVHQEEAEEPQEEAEEVLQEEDPSGHQDNSVDLEELVLTLREDTPPEVITPTLAEPTLLTEDMPPEAITPTLAEPTLLRVQDLTANINILTNLQELILLVPPLPEAPHPLLLQEANKEETITSPIVENVRKGGEEEDLSLERRALSLNPNQLLPPRQQFKRQFQQSSRLRLPQAL